MNSIYVFIFGLVMGSFYYVVGTRLVEGKSLIKPGSHCEYCKHPLKVLDLVPVLSYIFLRGKCRYCHKKISVKYPLYELLTAILFTISYLKYDFTYSFYVSLILSSLTVLIFITDFKEMIILDSPLVISSILFIALELIYFDINAVIHSLISGILSFIAMYLIGKLGYFLFKKESLGGGDIKFSFVMGLILGFKYACIALILSTFLALPYALSSVLLDKEHEVPFGPFLVASTFIVFYFYDKFAYVFYYFI